MPRESGTAHDHQGEVAVRVVKVLPVIAVFAVVATGCAQDADDDASKEPATSEETDELEEDEYGVEDLSNAEEATNAEGDTVHVVPQGESAKIFHWQHRYGFAVTIEDFYITDTLPAEVDEHARTDQDGRPMAVVNLTLANDGEHAEGYHGEGVISASSLLQELGLRDGLDREGTNVAEGGGISLYEGISLVSGEDVGIDGGEEVTDLYRVFPLDRESEAGTYYLTYSGYSDILYTWETSEH